ncbi:MAG: invasion associated locus B family protein [Rhodobacteraceae bacterium]|nr:invasion associated locus B family protein [Paracoccaceae bacterium]MCY4251565.1 invasion associated locus B family protein [Paracoccaceae bacterium]MCY4309490.1 invasion associated locus B family protein [Paracoccaceae bacterium]
MKIRFVFGIAFWAALASPLFSQQEIEGIDQINDWIVYKTTSSSEQLHCGIMAQPAGSSYTQNGKTVKVTRGITRLTISILGGRGGTELVSLEAGFDIKRKSSVSLVIDGNRKFNLHLDPEDKILTYAWPLYSDDEKIVSALQRGGKAVVTMISQRGTTVVDTYSLNGVTAGLKRASLACQ